MGEALRLGKQKYVRLRHVVNANELRIELGYFFSEDNEVAILVDQT
jgi:hypothetical protein